ncbi:hypothetical protein ACQB60_08400 [Actinomycetota bacterium Odt1-20B]
MTEEKARQRGVEIPGLCWDQKPGDTYRCCRRAGHGGDHHHYYGGGRWPQQGGGPPG